MGPQRAAAPRFTLVNEFPDYLADRRYSPKTVRAYAFDLLAFCRWLAGEDAQLGDVTAETLLRYLPHCRTATFRGRPGGNVYSIRDGRSTGYAAATVNRRMAAISGMFEFRAMRDPDKLSPVPRARPAVRRAAPSGAGCSGTRPRRGRRRSCGSGSPGRLPKGLDAGQATALLDSFRSWRDKAIAGLIQACLLLERPDANADGTAASRLFLVAKGSNRGRPLTPEGLRAVFRYHRERSGAAGGRPHALRHSFGTALAEAGTDLAVIQALMGHDHVDSSARYIHLAPAHVRAAFDDVRARQR